MNATVKYKCGHLNCRYEVQCLSDDAATLHAEAHWQTEHGAAYIGLVSSGKYRPFNS